MSQKPTIKGIETLFVGKELIQLQSVDSTNNYAATLLKDSILSDGTVILAHEQSQGRGQRGSTWSTEPDKNLTFSIVFSSCRIDVKEQARLSVAVALGVRDGLEKVNISAQVKWPNDIFVNRKKIAGILIENTLSGATIKNSIVGIGLNVNQEIFDGFPATSVRLESGITDRMHVLKCVLESVEKWYLLARTAPWTELESLYLEKAWPTAEFEPASHKGELKKVRLIGLVPDGRAKFQEKKGDEFIAELKEVSFNP